MTFGRKFIHERNDPGVATTDSDEKRKALAAYAKAPAGAEELKTVAARFSIKGGRKWSEFTMQEITLLHRHTVGGVPLPLPVGESIVWTSDESEEGRAFNARIPFSEVKPPW